MKKICLAAVALVTMWACEKEIPLKQDEAEPRIVVNGLFQAEDTVWIQLSESRNVLYKEELPNITNATAQLLDKNSNVLGDFTHDTDGRYYVPGVFPVAGETSGLNVSAPNLKSVKATSEAPSLLSDFTVDTVAAPNDELEFTIRFQDDPDQINYYGISITYFGTWINEFGEEEMYQDSYISTKEFYVTNGEEDVDGTKYAQEFFFSDASLNGQMITFKARKYNYEFEDSGFFKIQVKSLSEDASKYKVSYAKYLEVQGSPFAEPVQVYSNIEDGFGIFGGISAVKDTIWR